MVFISHDLSVVRYLADTVAVMYLGKIVEFADTRELFHHPAHPYTVGLLNSVPVLGRKGKNRLVPIQGMVPMPTDVIPGCAFAPRCPHAMKICREQKPPLKDVRPGHQTACWLY
jgi:oligopeptide/dipeptide ABC transporter ATP-binding protein